MSSIQEPFVDTGSEPRTVSRGPPTPTGSDSESISGSGSDVDPPRRVESQNLNQDKNEDTIREENNASPVDARPSFADRYDEIYGFDVDGLIESDSKTNRVFLDPGICLGETEISEKMQVTFGIDESNMSNFRTAIETILNMMDFYLRKLDDHMDENLNIAEHEKFHNIYYGVTELHPNGEHPYCKINTFDPQRGIGSVAYYVLNELRNCFNVMRARTVKCMQALFYKDPIRKNEIQKMVNTIKDVFIPAYTGYIRALFPGTFPLSDEDKIVIRTDIGKYNSMEPEIKILVPFPEVLNGSSNNEKSTRKHVPTSKSRFNSRSHPQNNRWKSGEEMSSGSGSDTTPPKRVVSNSPKAVPKIVSKTKTKSKSKFKKTKTKTSYRRIKGAEKIFSTLGCAENGACVNLIYVDGAVYAASSFKIPSSIPSRDE